MLLESITKKERAELIKLLAIIYKDSLSKYKGIRSMANCIYKNTLSPRISDNHFFNLKDDYKDWSISGEEVLRNSGIKGKKGHGILAVMDKLNKSLPDNNKITVLAVFRKYNSMLSEGDKELNMSRKIAMDRLVEINKGSRNREEKEKANITKQVSGNAPDTFFDPDKHDELDKSTEPDKSAEPAKPDKPAPKELSDEARKALEQEYKELLEENDLDYYGHKSYYIQGRLREIERLLGLDK